VMRLFRKRLRHDSCDAVVLGRRRWR